MTEFVATVNSLKDKWLRMMTVFPLSLKFTLW